MTQENFPVEQAIEHILWAKFYDKWFIDIIKFDPHSTSWGV